MRFSTILPVLATLACAVSAIPTANFGHDVAEHHDTKRATGASTILSTSTASVSN